METSRISVLTSLSLAATLLLGGCTWFTDPPQSSAATAAPVATAGQEYYVVSADFTPLYRTGPQQPNGPDQSLPKDTLVTLLRRNFGFSRVQLENGMNGYVATEDLAPAPPERTAPQPEVSANIENNSAIVQRYSEEKAASSAAASTSNAEALPDLPEPRLEPEPTPANMPEFRY